MGRICRRLRRGKHHLYILYEIKLLFNKIINVKMEEEEKKMKRRKRRRGEGRKKEERRKRRVGSHITVVMLWSWDLKKWLPSCVSGSTDRTQQAPDTWWYEK